MKDCISILLPVSCLIYIIFSCVFDAFENLSGGRVRHLEETNPDLATKLDAWLADQEKIRTFFKLLLFVSVLLIGFCVNELTAFYTPIPAPWSSIFYSILVILLVYGSSELFSKLIFSHFDLLILEITMPLISFGTRMIMIPAAPVNAFLKRKSRQWFGTKPKAEQTTVEDEILDLVEDEPAGQLEEGEKRMIKGIFDLPNMSVREIMTPRVDLIALPMTASIAEAKELIVSSGHSRIPVYGRSIDEIKGVLYAKDFVNPENDKKHLSELLHEPIFIPENKAVDELLHEIQICHNHFAVIIDEYGGTSGIVTFEDIIEEIVGDVLDEFDTAEDAPEKSQVQSDGSVLMEARTPLSEASEILNIDIPETESADTIGGYICSTLGRIPEQGETCLIPGLFSAVVVSADLRKINKIKVKVLKNENDRTEN